MFERGRKRSYRVQESLALGARVGLRSSLLEGAEKLGHVNEALKRGNSIRITRRIPF